MQSQSTAQAADWFTPCAGEPKPPRDRSTDATYWMARNIATLDLTVTPDGLAKRLSIGRDAAQRLIERLQAEGILGEPDLFGSYTLAGAGEVVRHD